MRNFFIGLLLLPIIELIIFLLAGNLIGIPETLFVVIGTGILGAILLKKQGLKAIRNVQVQLNQGIMPGDAILDSFCVLIGGVLLLFPGFLTDIVGAIMLIPPTRRIIKVLLMKGIQRKLQKKNRVTIIQ
ncbi:MULTISPECIES: FxsA family protein [Niallia]|uniref:FxsA family protein n=1 Tax=Niallia hominis TaxID=3133173 RepID=A0ABV1F0G1_9BACI|nr:FxsA family protein [Niallia sp. MER TA 168]MCM3363502.1 FxsA family protein [Niallia sp. MER TA 168]SLL35851.1 protein affecting phage T7 exclusion by the F plasmid [Mycobacteroides abscessus subsp. abscessus]HEO8420009.1 FxsA family protein [Yersinia enterocolitica]